MKIALCQMANAGSMGADLEKSLRAIETAAGNGADLILFPEVHLTEFFPQYPGQDISAFRVAGDSPTVQAFCRAARAHRIMVSPNFLLEENGHAYDASLLISAEVDLRESGQIRSRRPYTQLRRPELYR